VDLENFQTLGAKLFTGLSAKDAAVALRAAEPRETVFEKGALLWGQDEPIPDIVLLSQGVCLGYKYSADGTMQFLRTFEPGQYIGLEALLTRRMTMPMAIFSNTPGAYISIPYQPWVCGTELPCETRFTLLRNIARLVADDSIRSLNKAGVLSHGIAREKIIAFLSIVRARKGTATVDIGMTQGEFAQYLCISRTTLSEELNKMRREGVLDYTDTVYTLL
jgi:CRP-like cAMP-binding protein